MASLAQMGRHIATPAFEAVVVPRVAMTPYTPLGTNVPGPHMQQKARVENSARQISEAMRRAVNDRDTKIRENRLAGEEDKSVDVVDFLNPLQPFLSPFVFASAALDGLGMVGYYRADRRRPANDLTRDETDSLLRPLKENTYMKILFGQQAQVNQARANLAVREKGLPRSPRVAAAAARQGAVQWIYNPATPAPAFI